MNDDQEKRIEETLRRSLTRVKSEEAQPVHGSPIPRKPKPDPGSTYFGRTHCGLVDEVEGAAQVLDALERESGWRTPLPAGRGRGVALGVRHIGGGGTSVIMRLLPGGEVEVQTGVADQGGGAYTVLRRVAAAVMATTTISFATYKVHRGTGRASRLFQ